MPIGGAFNVKFILGARSLKQGNNECIVYIIGCTIQVLYSQILPRVVLTLDLAPEPCNWRAELPLWRRWSMTKRRHCSLIIWFPFMATENAILWLQHESLQHEYFITGGTLFGKYCIPIYCQEQGWLFDVAEVKQKASNSVGNLWHWMIVMLHVL